MATKSQRAALAEYRKQQRQNYERDSRHAAITRSQVALDRRVKSEPPRRGRP